MTVLRPDATTILQCWLQTETATEWTRRHTGTTWSVWARSLPVTGTVSMVSGQPTGAIIQRGSTATGDFIRFADGTQICTHSLAIGPLNLALGSIFQGSATVTWTFPAAFSVLPVVSGLTSSTSAWVTATPATLTNIALRGCSGASLPATAAGDDPLAAARSEFTGALAAVKGDEGRIKAIWIMATNPVVSLPDADKVKRALAKCELVVVSDVMADTDTTAFAHLLLPAQGWGEKDGTVTNSERCISRQRAFLPPIGEARPDWWALSEVARRWGYGAQFPYASAHEIFDEHAQLTASGNADDASPRYLNLGGMVGLGKTAYDKLEPVRWPVLKLPPPLAGEGWGGGVLADDVPCETRMPPAGLPPVVSMLGNAIQGTSESAHAANPQSSPASGGGGLAVFADGRFYTPDRRARFVPTTPQPPAGRLDDDFPLALNTGRVRDHWHTMTRTGLAPRLATHVAEPFVDLHPQDALLCGVRENDLARVTSTHGNCVVRVRMSGEMPRKSVFVPIHWNAQFASDARVGKLVNPVVDPVSGEPEFKHTPVRVEPFMVAWHGFALSRDGDDQTSGRDGDHQTSGRDGELKSLTADAAWWTKIAGDGYARHELAVDAGGVQRNPDAVAGDGMAFAGHAFDQHLHAFHRTIDVTHRRSRAAFLAEHVPRLDGVAHFHLDAALGELADSRETELQMRREPVLLDPVAGLPQIGEYVAEILPDEVRQHPAVVDLTVPADKRLRVGFLPETRNQRPQDQMLREAHLIVRRHFEIPHF